VRECVIQAKALEIEQCERLQRTVREPGGDGQRGADLVRQGAGQLRLERADLLLRGRREKLEVRDVSVGVDEALSRNRLQRVSEQVGSNRPSKTRAGRAPLAFA
jgi:hypothetical protein